MGTDGGNSQYFSGDSLGRCENAVLASPGSSPLRFNLGLELASAGRIDEAIREFRYASELDLSDADALNEIGRLEISRGRLNSAAGILEKALARKSDHAGALNNRGVICFLTRRYTKAAEYFRAALDANSRLADAWFNLADTYEVLGDREQENQARVRYRELCGDGTGGNGPPRAEELIAEVYRQLSQMRNRGEVPEKVILKAELWNVIQDYRRSLGVVTGPVPDYLTEDGLFGLEIWYGDQPGIRVE
jgi:tetratricopeptide (TPR) repeat protein